MKKTIIILLLIATCLAFIGSISMLASDPGRDLDMEEFFLSTWYGFAAVLCLTAVMFIVRWMFQVRLSAQILLSFFFYSWRNSIYDGDTRRSLTLFPSLETQTRF